MKNEENAPLDDRGIRVDEIIDVCESLVKRCWKISVEDDRELSTKELEEIANTMELSWAVMSSVIDYNNDRIMHGNDGIDLEYDDEDDEEEDYDVNDETL